MKVIKGDFVALNGVELERPERGRGNEIIRLRRKQPERKEGKSKGAQWRLLTGKLSCV